MTKTAETASVAETETVPTMPGLPLSGATEKVSESVNTLQLPPGLFMTSDHRYYHNGVGPLPSVTTILNELSKPALLNWKAREVARAAIQNPQMIRELEAADGEDAAISWIVNKSDEARDRAASVGSSVHLLADMASRGQESDSKGFQIDSGTRPYLEAFQGFLTRYDASSIVSSEKAVWSENGYAGTYDMLILLPTGGATITRRMDEPLDPELWLLDVKTSKGYYPEYGLQLAAYRWADSIILEGDPQKYPMPEVQRTGVLHLRPDQYKEGWRLVEYPTSYELDYLPFLGLLEVYKWRQEGRFSKQRLNTV